jgi:hypothetical protein
MGPCFLPIVDMGNIERDSAFQSWTEYFTNDNWLIHGHDIPWKYARCFYESRLFVCLCQRQRSSHSPKQNAYFFCFVFCFVLRADVCPSQGQLTLPLPPYPQTAIACGVQAVILCAERKFGFF